MHYGQAASHPHRFPPSTNCESNRGCPNPKRSAQFRTHTTRGKGNKGRRGDRSSPSRGAAWSSRRRPAPRRPCPRSRRRCRRRPLPLPPPPPRSPVPRTRLGISVTGNRRVESRGSPAWCVRGCRRFYEGLHPAWGWIGLGFGAEAAAAARRRRGGRRRRREEEEEIKGERKAERRGEEKRWKILDSARVIDSSGSSVTGNFILRLSVGKTYQGKYLRFREPSGISSAWDGVFGFRGSSEKLISWW